MSEAKKKISSTWSFIYNTIFFAIFVAVASMVPNVFKKQSSVVQADTPYSQSGYYTQGGYDGGYDGGVDGTDTSDGTSDGTGTDGTSGGTGGTGTGGTAGGCGNQANSGPF